MLQNVRGTKDLLPDETRKWQLVENVFRNTAKLFDYQELRTPIFESTAVFSRSIGETSDIVNKEMYTFEDRGGDSLTLRPEMTAALVRSIIQNGMVGRGQIHRLWYYGPFFRYERPQKGRYRQFHQFGAECIASPFPEADVEVISLSDSIIKALGIKDYTLRINTLANQEVRDKYRNALVEFFSSKKAELSEDSLNRLEKNPLRILDSKDPRDIKASEGHPVLIDFLDEQSKEHFDSVKQGLEALGINYQEDNKLVRGLDYYNHTVFEFRSGALGAQDSFGGGGRYDNLIEQLGGKSTPAVGFAFGVERLIMILETENQFNDNSDKLDYFIVSDHQYISKAIELNSKLHGVGKSSIYDIKRRSFKAQLKEADKTNAQFVIILGEDEIANSYYSLKNLSTGEQSKVSLEDLIG